MTPKEKLQTHSVLTNYRDGIQHVLQTTLAGINRGIVKAVLCLSICLLFTACSSDSSIATEATTQSPRPPTKEPATIVSREPNPATEGTVGALARSYIVALSDNASGVAVMLETAKMLKDVETAYNIYFVAFGAEEVGLIGSRYYVKQMTK